MQKRGGEPSERNSARVQALSLAAPSLAAWFAENVRSFPWREGRTPYKVLVSETMLQQTRIETVLRYYERFMTAFPTVRDLAAAPSDLVMKHWEGLGYYSRARHLKEAAERCTEEYGGELPERFDELRKLPGIGDYSAGAIASLCHDEPVPAVDGNVLRVLARFFGDARDVRLPEVRKDAAEVIRKVLERPTSSTTACGGGPPSALHSSGFCISSSRRLDLQAVTDPKGEGIVRPSAFNEGLMELGETLCAPKGKPQCEACPLKSGCRAHAEGREEQLPYRSAGAARSIEEKTVWLFLCGGKVALEKRPDQGMLRGLYGFPMTEGKLAEDEAAAALSARGIDPVNICPLGGAKHVFTHREWHMTGYLAETETPLPGFIYVSMSALAAEYALPSAFRYYRNKLVIDN